MFSTWMELKAESPVREEHRLFQELNSKEHQGTEFHSLGSGRIRSRGIVITLMGLVGKAFLFGLVFLVTLCDLQDLSSLSRD